VATPNGREFSAAIKGREDAQEQRDNSAPRIPAAPITREFPVAVTRAREVSTKQQQEIQRPKCASGFTCAPWRRDRVASRLPGHPPDIQT